MSGSSVVGGGGNEIGVTKSEEEIGVSKATMDDLNRTLDRALDDLAKIQGWDKGAAGTGMVTEKSWLSFVFLTKPPAGIERNAEPTGAMISKETGIMKERVPDSFIDILKKRRLFEKLPPVEDETSIMYSRFPKLRDINISIMASKNICIDLHADVVRQHAEKGYAEVGVDFVDGVKTIFVLPQD